LELFVFTKPPTVWQYHLVGKWFLGYFVVLYLGQVNNSWIPC